jgi:2-hydroxychromene-2-carboxylate isomerase
MKTLRFAYDVQCPYAYLASKRVKALVAATGTNTTLEYFPVLLGGLYADTKAPQGKDGSASDVMAPAKAKSNAYDLAREAKRWNVPLIWNSKHPIRSVKAMRILTSITNQELRSRATDLLYDAYWQYDLDIAQDDVLVSVLKDILSREQVLSGMETKEQLKANTTWASSRGVFGVPSFWILDEHGKESSRFWYGQDRTFLVARALGVVHSHPLSNPLRLVIRSNNSNKTHHHRPRLEFFHDFSSPWSYLGSTQIVRIAQENNAELIFKPILLGAIFKQIGTANVPMYAMSEAKRTYMSQDLEDWKEFRGGIQLDFPSTFPIRTVIPLRVAIIEPRVTPHIYKAAWVDGYNIGDEQVLIDVLMKAGFTNAKEMVQRASTDNEIKTALTKNTNEAIERGLCGVPSFSVNGQSLIWGQDRYHVVEDELLLGGGGGGTSLPISGGSKL